MCWTQEQIDAHLREHMEAQRMGLVDKDGRIMPERRNVNNTKGLRR